MTEEYTNPWTFYNSYLFSYTVAYTVGFWDWTVISEWGQFMVLLWGLPAMTIGILVSMVFANIMYRVVMVEIIKKCSWTAKATKHLPYQEASANQNLLMLLMIATGCFILWWLKDLVDDEEMNSGLGSADKMFFLFTWYTTLGIADASAYEILGNPRGLFMLYVVHQMLFVLMGIMIGTAIKLLDDLGDAVGHRLGLSEILDDDESDDDDDDDESDQKNQKKAGKVEMDQVHLRDANDSVSQNTSED